MPGPLVKINKTVILPNAVKFKSHWLIFQFFTLDKLPRLKKFDVIFFIFDFRQCSKSIGFWYSWTICHNSWALAFWRSVKVSFVFISLLITKFKSMTNIRIDQYTFLHVELRTKQICVCVCVCVCVCIYI